MRFAVGQKTRFPESHCGVGGDLHDASGFFCGHDKYFAARGKHGRRAVRRDVHLGQILYRLLHPVFAHLVKVGFESHGNLVFRAGGKIDRPQIGSAGVNHVPVARQCGLHVEDLLMALFFQVLALLVHRPDVLDAVAVRDEVDAPVPDHRVRGSAVVVSRKRFGLMSAIKAPDVLRPAALVALGLAPLLVPAREVERVPIGGPGSFRGFIQRNNLALAGGVDQNQLVAGQRRVTLGGDHQPPVGRPSLGLHVALPGAALGQAAADGHGVDLAGTFIVGQERHGLAVGRDHRLGLLACAGGEPVGHATFHAHRPQVAF